MLKFPAPVTGAVYLLEDHRTKILILDLAIVCKMINSDSSKKNPPQKNPVAIVPL